MVEPIAVVGMACRFPGASSPQELWENVLAQRQAFRKIPAERLRIHDYFAADRSAEDRTYSQRAAVLEGWEFDRTRFRVSGDAYRCSDLAHWLALDVASQALTDAGFQDGQGLPRESTGVFLGNTLTGEFSRANALRLRWPYVRRTAEAALEVEGVDADTRRRLLDSMEARFKAPFQAAGDETLAGSLSNTIAGRICNYYDLNGGGYTVDGACASSLLSITNACTALQHGYVDAAIAGGVDVSLDPLELVGFAKAGALAENRMLVYDERSDGFIPGEGCGLVVLMRQSDAVAAGLRIRALVAGWGISSDGSGGLTRPGQDGQRMAVERAWRHAGRDIGNAAYFEGHGTGTVVGDATELSALMRARESAGAAEAAAIGSVKALIGHCKAAAGVAGLIKTTMALQDRTLPPTAGCERPHKLLTNEGATLRVLRQDEPWPEDRPMTGGVSAMGFGGINVHLVLEETPRERSAVVDRSAIQRLMRSPQDAELFLFAGASKEDALAQVDRVATLAPGLSISDLTDVAAKLARLLQPGAVRAALVASTAEELTAALANVREVLLRGADVTAGVYVGEGKTRPRIGLLFPGQGSPANGDGGVWRRRFESVAELYEGTTELRHRGVATEVVQPAIIRASVAALRILTGVGIDADVAVGHSLGELMSLHWAGVIGETDALHLAARRGRAMGDPAIPHGAMAAVAGDSTVAASLIEDDQVNIAGLNSPSQTVLSGAAAGIESILARARRRQIQASMIPVSHAFHSPLMAPAADVFARELSEQPFQTRTRDVASTVTGGMLNGDDLRALLVRQIIAPVRFTDAVEAAGPVELWIECGPGAVLTRLVKETGEDALAVDACSGSLRGLLEAVGKAFALGAPVRPAVLFEDRFTRRFHLDHRPRFIANPCEQAPAGEATPVRAKAVAGGPAVTGKSAIETLREIAAAHAELPVSSVRDESRLLSDLHLNSIVVGRIIADTCNTLEYPVPTALTEFADASVGAIASALEEMGRKRQPSRAEERHPAGVSTWVRAFRPTLVEKPLAASRSLPAAGSWEIVAANGDPRRDQVIRILSSVGGSGVVALLPADVDADCVPLLLRAGKAALGGKAGDRFVLVQPARGAASFARTLHLEAPQIATRILSIAKWNERVPTWIAAEATSGGPFVEAEYDESGRRFEPVLECVVGNESTASALTADDLLLITGGGKGIAAECGLALARATGVGLALIGRARPEDDAELAANLARIRSFVPAAYYSADVTDATAVRNAVRAMERSQGPVTAVLHGAGANVPKLITQLDEEAFRRTLGPKVDGLRNVLGAVDPDRLRLLIGFGSIIGRIGLSGEADYAVANEWLAQLVDDWGREHPYCRALTIEWSVWSGIGMGQRLGRVESLLDRGVTPISPDQGVAALLALLGRSSLSGPVVVTGRFGLPPTAHMKSSLPFRRYLETVRVHYPGVELVADATITAESDPHISDHDYHGQPLFAAVMGLEAMAQAAMALAGWRRAPGFENVRLERPVNCPATIRVAALLREDGAVEVALRSSETGFQADHFTAVCRRADAVSERKPDAAADPGSCAIAGRVLYETVLFQRGRYQRLHGYQQLHARECLAEIESREDGWFDRYAAPELELGDPGARDAILHSIQACIPHRVLLPAGVEKISIVETGACSRIFSHARERSSTGDMFIYDVEVTGDDGRIRERWEGLLLKAVEERSGATGLPDSLIPVYLERRLMEAAPWASVNIMLDTEATRGMASSRPDGKPDGRTSFSHCGSYRLALEAANAAGCDLEKVETRTETQWQDLLGPARYTLAREIAATAREDLATAATRVWSALESLKKAGLPCDAPLVLRAVRPHGSVELASGALTIVSCEVRLPAVTEPVICCLAVQPATHAAYVANF